MPDPNLAIMTKSHCGEIARRNRNLRIGLQNLSRQAHHLELAIDQQGGHHMVRRRRPAHLTFCAGKGGAEPDAREPAVRKSADLHQPGVTHRVDIARAPLRDASYDVVIAHHVLEHIPEDREARRELFRLLKPGGTAVVNRSTPRGRRPMRTPRLQRQSNATHTFRPRTTGGTAGWTLLIA
jgi:SAM-dependent methyltransferase